MFWRQPSSLLMLAALAVGAPFGAQAVEGAAAKSVQGGFGSGVTVHEAQIPVVVRRHGEAVPDLGKADFQVNEDGASRDVLSARRIIEEGVERSEPPGTEAEQEEAAPPQTQHILLAFDDSIERLPVLERALGDVREWIEERSASGTEWAVVLIGEEPRLLLPFSSRSSEIDAALDVLLRIYRGERVKFQFDTSLLATMNPNNETQGGVGSADRDQPRSGTLAQVVQGASERALTASKARSATRLQQVLLALSDVPGTKAMVLFYSGLVTPDAAGGLQANRTLFWSRYLRFWSVASDVAVAAGFRVYATDVDGLNWNVSTRGRSAEYTVHHGMPASELEKSIAGMLAVRTGGRRLELNDYSEILRQSKRDLEDYYVLSVQVPHGYDGQHHQWRVKVDRRGVEVRYPRSYVDLSPRAKLLAELRAPATLPKTGGRLQSRVRIVKTARRGDHEAVSVEAGVLARQVGLVPSAGGDREGALEVFVATYAPAGTPLTLDAKRETFRLSGAGELGDQALTVEREVELPITGGTIAVGFFDPVDGGTALRAVQVASRE